MTLHRKYIKNYKKNTIAILSSISFSIALMVALLILTHTDHRVSVLKNQYFYGATDIILSDVNLTTEQTDILKENNDIKYLEIERGKYITKMDNGQHAVIYSGNDESILSVSSLLEGRMPENENEIVAERWVLHNLGISDELNKTITLNVFDYNSYNGNDNTGKQSKARFTLVGIIEDLASKKRYGDLSLYSSLEHKDYKDLSVNIKFYNRKNVNQKIQKIVNELQIKKSDVQENIWLENKQELVKQDIVLILITLLVCMLVIAGVYRISLISRQSQYGILKALGMKEKQIRNLIASEIFELYLCSIPIGCIFGLLGSYIVSVVSNNRSVIMYFWGKEEKFHLVIPFVPIFCCIFGMGLILCIIVFIASYQINHQSIIAMASNALIKNNYRKHIFRLKSGKVLKPSQKLGFRYTFTDLKTTMLIVLSVSLGCGLLFGVFYQAKLIKINNYNSKKLWYLNCDYRMSITEDDMRSRKGISKETVKLIQQVDGVCNVELQNAMPIKVIDDISVKRNDKFLNNISSKIEEAYDIKLKGNDSTDKVYMTKLKGFSQNALKELEEFIAEGDFKAENLKNNEIILFIPRVYTHGTEEGKVGYTKMGIPTMQYKVGDTVKIKYRKDIDTSSDEYWNMKDTKAEYTYKQFKVVATVYYPYLRSTSAVERVYPLFITSNQIFDELLPGINTYTCADISVDRGLSQNQLNQIDIQLADLAIKNKNAVSRSLVEQKNDIDTLYQKQVIYLYGIAIVVFILVLINVMNNLKYRIQTRKREFGICRAVGMRLKMVWQVICFENIFLSVTALIIALLLSIITSKILYNQSGLYDYGIDYSFGYVIYIGIFSVTLILSYFISNILIKEIKDRDIMENISDVE